MSDKQDIRPRCAGTGESHLHYVDLEYTRIYEGADCGVHVLTLGREICIPREDIHSHDRQARKMTVLAHEVGGAR